MKTTNLIRAGACDSFFQDLLISVDQLTESEGEDSFTIDGSRINTAIECAHSQECADYLALLLGCKRAQVFRVKCDRHISGLLPLPAGVI